MNRCGILLLACGLVAGLPPAISVGQPAPDEDPPRRERRDVRPDEPPPGDDGEFDRGPGMRRRGMRGEGEGWRRFEDPEQELRRRREDMVRRQEVFTFMEDNSPRRWRMFQDIPEGPRKQRIRELFTSRYQTMERVREQGDQELYDVLIARLKAEDEAWGKAVDLRNAPEDEKSERRKELREAVTRLVELGLKERELRIVRLEKAMAQEKERLAKDSSNPTPLVERTYSNYESGREGLAGPERPGGPEGPPPGPPERERRRERRGPEDDFGMEGGPPPR